MIELPPKIQLDSKHISYFKDKNISSLVKDINNNYYYWNKVKYKSPKNLSPEKLWGIVKLSRFINYSPLSVGKYKFNYFITENFLELLHYFDINFRGDISHSNFISQSDKKHYSINSLMEEAISSSKMEGATTTHKIAKEMLLKGTKPKDSSEQMIINNYHTIEYIRENKNQDLNSENLLKIHKLITNKTLENNQEEGFFRTNNDINIFNKHSREAVHTPPNFKEIPNLINDLSNFFNSDDKSIHPIIKGIIIHFMIAWIHPFVDGNGRTARSLFYWFMLKNGYGFIQYLSISKFIAESKSQYEKAYLYTENDDNDLNYFIIYNLKTIKKSFKSFKNYVGIKKEENISILRMVKKLGVNERQGYLIKKIYENPDIIFTVKEIEKRFSVSNFTARADLTGLVKKGFIESIAVNKTKRNYIKSKDFDKLININ